MQLRAGCTYMTGTVERDTDTGGRRKIDGRGEAWGTGCALEVEIDGCGGRHEGRELVGRELPSIEDREVRGAKGDKLLLCGADKHVVDEERMVRTGTHNAHFDPFLQPHTQ
jgi:hypothetical protein